MPRKKRNSIGIAVPWNVYKRMQGAFTRDWARMCVDMDHGSRIFHPGDPFIDVLRWLWRGIEDDEMEGPAPLPATGKASRTRCWLTFSAPSTASSRSRPRRR